MAVFGIHRPRIAVFDSHHLHMTVFDNHHLRIVAFDKSAFGSRHIEVFDMMVDSLV
jgi:hypothetical protein